MSTFPVMVRSVSPPGEPRWLLGDPVVDRYLEFVAGRCRPNTVRAVAHDLKTFFTVIDTAPFEVSTTDVFELLAHQRGDCSVVRIRTANQGCRPARSRAVCRRSRGSTRIWSHAATRRSR